MTAGIRQLGLEPPACCADLLETAESQAEHAAFWWTNELRGVLAALAAAGVSVHPLKGPYLAQRLYGNPAARTSLDLDLLVRRNSLAAATTALAGQGFAPGGRPDDYHRTWVRGSTALELHWNVENPLAYDFELEAAWSRGGADRFLGEPVWRLDAADELAYLCLHGVRHRFDRLGLVLDIARACQAQPGLRARVLQRPERQRGLDGVVYLGLRLASLLLSDDAGLADPPWADACPLPLRARQHLDRVAETLWRDLHRPLDAPQPTLDWQAQHRFFLSLESTAAGRWQRRLQHARILATRLVQDDFEFAARFGMRRVWQVWLLRPVRLVQARFTRPGVQAR